MLLPLLPRPLLPTSTEPLLPTEPSTPLRSSPHLLPTALLPQRKQPDLGTTANMTDGFFCSVVQNGKTYTVSSATTLTITDVSLISFTFLPQFPNSLTDLLHAVPLHRRQDHGSLCHWLFQRHCLCHQARHLHWCRQQRRRCRLRSRRPRCRRCPPVNVLIDMFTRTTSDMTPVTPSYISYLFFIFQSGISSSLLKCI